MTDSVRLLTKEKIKYPEDYNPILEYWADMNSGLVVCKKIYGTYKKIVRDLKDNKSEFYYSNKRANHIIEFAENYCRHSKGKMGGKPVILETWEKAALATIFGFIDIEGNRKYRKAKLIVGKKNGKSLIASIVALYLLVADGEPGPEVYAVAGKKDQARIIWLESKRMRNKSPSLRKRIKALINELSCELNDGSYKPVASDVDTLDGLNVHGAMMDEFHQWKNGKALYDIVADGVSAREQPLIFMTSTAGKIREDIYDDEYNDSEKTINGYEDPDGYHDERTISFIYEIDSRAEWTDESCWIKANPGLGTIKNLKTLREKVERAIHNPSMVKNLVCKEFNIRETVGESWLTFEELDNRETFDLKELKPRYGICGYDLSKTTDLSAAVVLFCVPNDERIYFLSMFWIPEDLLEKRVKADEIPYDIWRDQGLLRTCEGNRISYHDIVEWFIEVQNEHDIYLPYAGYDNWSAIYMVEEMQAKFGKSSQEPVIQGKKTLSGPMGNLGADIRSHRVVYNNNPCLKWNLTNVSVDSDVNNNIQPIKGKSTKRRIDGFAAMLNAYVVYERHKEEYHNMI